MGKKKVAVTIDQYLVSKLDHMVAEGRYSSRSSAIEEAVLERINKLEKKRLAEESARLDPDFEQALAEEGLEGELSEWPEY